ncbi:MAG: class I adenylate-forming enzyme family protein, partial [Vulcanimicrobiaceae bacterium]
AYLDRMTLLDLLAASVHDRPHELAVNDVSYAALRQGMLRVAARLHERGLRPGDRFALYCENRLGFVFGYLAALRLGAIVVPTNVLYRASDLEHVLVDGRVGLVLASEHTRAFVADLPGRYPIVEANDVERWATDGAIANSVPAHCAQTDDVATIIYTSGTTGRSKGAMMSHGNLAAISANLATAWRWTAADTLLIALPLFHVHGLGAALNTTLAVGGRVIVHERFDARRVIAALRADGVTMFFGVPTMYVRLLEALGDAPAPKLRLCVSGSAALAPEVFDEFRRRFGMDILERYGATEFGFALTNRFAGPRVAGSVGVPFPGMRVRVAGPDDAEPLADGAVGELLVAGSSMFPGYWENPTASAAAFAVDCSGERWYRSGDLAVHDRDHDVYRIVGRIKELIISGGFNVYPREVEEEIDQFPTVVASAVVAKPDRARGELPVAFVEVRDGFDGEALLAHLRERLASFKVPREVIVIDALPRNALGKIEKHRLTTRFSG